ncbi:hypothetical protein M409DRAFT_65908 [Zasmidium cellare ATCC 36951]|uniref:Major facilitator superfamily (MFS) profile domain-containing protein n=1 Tax=Zasmidium cellare ATCC 36951 TaxID=1080233 RepID=A0A6A6CNY1_ZASCE|nr:uncharacterized protein M409DRAFT_65908 [Zasmidium cellare ATCC 36951]KAF2167820.1 hypothetical protein M409DRAFT_65908 [Zasmidium cellare ATCC 36951]
MKALVGVCTCENVDSLEEFTPAQQRRIKRIIDWRLIPALEIMYGASLMDRKNISNAFITLSFFITYTLFSLPMPILCRKMGSPRLLPGLCFMWGCVIIGFGFAKHWSDLVGLRIVLGFIEDGFFPGCIYLLSTWFTRYEVAKRYAVFYAIGGIGTALTGILAYGMMQLDGLGGLAGWQWILVLQGLLTCVCAVIGGLAIVQFPYVEKKKPSRWFLKPEEIDFVVRRLEQDRSDVDAEPFSFRKYFQAAKDIKVWGFALVFFCTTTVAYPFAFFLPIILHDTLGFGLALSQSLVAPPYVMAVLIMYATAWYSDRYRSRAPAIVFNCAVALTGLLILGFASRGSARYFGAFLAAAGASANMTATLAYQANRVRGQWKRAFSSATLSSLGGIGGVCGSLKFRSQDAGHRRHSITCATLSLYFWLQNKRADRGEIVINKLPGFRYTL